MVPPSQDHHFSAFSASGTCDPVLVGRQGVALHEALRREVSLLVRDELSLFTLLHVDEDCSLLRSSSAAGIMGSSSVRTHWTEFE